MPLSDDKESKAKCAFFAPSARLRKGMVKDTRPTRTSLMTKLSGAPTSWGVPDPGAVTGKPSATELGLPVYRPVFVAGGRR